MNRIGHLFSQVLFSLITPFLLMPGIARLSLTRRIIAFCFGRLYGNKYDHIIASFEDKYAEPISAALKKAKDRLNNETLIILDSGTGTGFVTKQAAKEFPRAFIIAMDILPGMLRIAWNNFRSLEQRVFPVQADTFSLPLANESVDLVLAQNTIPAFHEYHRVCRPGGMVLYVDTSAGWIAGLARRLVERHHLFGNVEGAHVGMGFFVLAQKEPAGDIAGIECSKTEDIQAILKCPVDGTNLTFHEKLIVCENGHSYGITDGIPALMPNAQGLTLE
ncbi:MAG: class I SAM-dependent methyltransferase [Nitrospirota bacterium]